jgi:hypothetical protein
MRRCLIGLNNEVPGLLKNNSTPVLNHKVALCFLFNNQTDPLIIQIYSVIKLYMFRASSASKHSQDGTEFHPDSAWKRSSKHA